MKCSSLTIIIVAAACFMAGASPSSAQSGPYYALPAWDQKLPASTRFVPVLFQEFCTPACEQIATGILDRETGLVWERIPSSSAFDFRDAQTTCARRVRANRAGWRLPSVDELTSLIYRKTTGDVALPPGHPFLNVVTAFTSYWTSDLMPIQIRLSWFLSTRHFRNLSSLRPSKILTLRGVFAEERSKSGPRSIWQGRDTCFAHAWFTRSSLSHSLRRRCSCSATARSRSRTPSRM